MAKEPVVVVGSGPPGAAATVFLERAGADVLLLEAGAARAARGLTLRVGGVTIAKHRRELKEREGVARTGDPNARLYEEIAPGGLSNHWSCAVPRFAPEDFEDAKRAGREFEWPLGYDELAPWYEQVEPLLCVAGATRDEAQLPSGNIRHGWQLGDDWGALSAEARELGRTVVAMPYAYGAETTFTPSGTVFNSFVRLVKPLEQRGRVRVRYGARVLRLEWSARERRVEAIVYRDEATQREERVACRAVVLAAGAICTPEILLRSKSPDFPAGLGNSHGVLGRFLHDHPLGKLMIRLDKPVSIYPPSYITRAALAKSAPLYAAAAMQWGGFGPLARSVKHAQPGLLAELGFSVFGTQAPSREHFVALDGGGNGAGGERLVLNIRHEPAALQALEQAREQILSLMQSVGWKPELELWNVEPPGSSNHYGGTCRMHASPELGMLDARGRLHEVKNVVVADSSAFTTGPEKNPVLTAMALAARASERLAAELASGDL